MRVASQNLSFYCFLVLVLQFGSMSFERSSLMLQLTLLDFEHGDLEELEGVVTSIFVVFEGNPNDKIHSNEKFLYLPLVESRLEVSSRNELLAIKIVGVFCSLLEVGTV